MKIYFASVTHDLRTPINGILGLIENVAQLTSNPQILDLIDQINNCS